MGSVIVQRPSGQPAYATVQEEGSGLTQRPTLNFVGSSFTAADDSGNNRTNVTADSDLDALASNTSNGLWARTGTGTGAARTVTGTTNKITVTNGDGVSGNPTLTTGSLVVHTDQANTWSTGAQDMGSATSFKVPTGASFAPTADGHIGYDSTKDSFVVTSDGTTVYNSGVLSVQLSGDTNNSSSGSGADHDHTLTYAIPAGMLNHVGRNLRVTQTWLLTTGAAAPTLMYKLKLGSGPTTIWSATAATPTSNLTSRTYSVVYDIYTSTAGASGQVICTNVTLVQAGILAGNSTNGTAQPVGTFDTTGSLTLTHSSQWGSAGTGTNTIQLLAAKVEVLN